MGHSSTTGGGPLRWRAGALPGLLALVLLAVALLWTSSALAALSVLVRNTSQLTWLAGRLPAPALQRLVRPTPGDLSLTGAVYQPVGPVALPGVVLVNGAEVPGGWRDPVIDSFARSLADLGLSVYVPDLPGLEAGAVGDETLDALLADVRWFAASPYSRRAVSLVGVCVGGSLGLLAAEDPATAPGVHAVVAIDPYADLREVLRAATVGLGPGLNAPREAFDMAPWVVADVARDAAATIDDGHSRQVLLAALAAAPADRPLRTLRLNVPPGDIGPEGEAWWRLLGNTSPAAFDRLYGQLPEKAQLELRRLSPITAIDRVGVPVWLAAPERDFAFPAGEARSLQEANPASVRLVRTAALDHVTPSISPTALVGYWRLWRFAAAGLRLLQ